MAWEHGRPQVSAQKIVPSIVIAVPHRDNFSSTWIMSLLRTLQNEYRFEVVMDGGSRPIDVSRNIMCSQALRWNYDYVFMLDSDIILDRDSIPKLLSVDKSIVSGLYRGRAPPNLPVANVDGKKLSEKLMGEPVTMSVDEIGMGCCLIKTAALRTIAQQQGGDWLCLVDHRQEAGKIVATFSYSEAEAYKFQCPHCKGMLLYPFFHWTHGFDLQDPGSEDFEFCKLCRKHGIEIFVRCDVTPSHETKVMISKEGITTVLKGSDEVKDE